MTAIARRRIFVMLEIDGNKGEPKDFRSIWVHGELVEFVTISSYGHTVIKSMAMR